MGMIQSSLNQLTLSAIGAVGGLAYGFKGAFKKPKAPQSEQPKKPEVTAESNWNTGNIVKIGRNYSNKNIKSYLAAANAVDSGNDAIAQKARAGFKTAEERLALVRQAQVSFTQKEDPLKRLSSEDKQRLKKQMLKEMEGKK